MKGDKTGKNTWLPLILTAILAILGGWTAGTEKQGEMASRISIVEEKCQYKDAEYKEIILKLDAIVSDVSEVKSTVMILKETKADRKYVE